jgi:hypothetical protein
MSGARLESASVSSLRRIAVLLAFTVALAPATALAQSGGAGDDQYVDPIGGGQPQSGSTGSGGSGSSGSNGSSNGPSLSASPSLSAQTPNAAPAAAGGNTLPRTGLDAGAVAAIGLALLSMGLGLRVRLAHDRH